MKKIFHPASERGHAQFDWLNSYHSFSFGHYHNASKIHFGALRVLNDDTVDPGKGFGKHPHDNMEIVSIPLEGDLHHQDSTGRDEIIRQNDVQIMSAGSGISHSEFNANTDTPVKFLQIWVFPKLRNITPRYEQKTFLAVDRKNKFQTVVAPDDATANFINQDAWFSLTNMSKDFESSYSLKKPGNGVYVFVIKGSIEIGDQLLKERDALGIWETSDFKIKSTSDSEVLLIDIPMQLS